MAKKVKKKAKRKKRKKKVIVYPKNYHLHKKKLEIMREIPIMPCSAISKDVHGLKFAHTQAEKVYNTYRIACESRGLVIRRIEGKTTDAHCPQWIEREGSWLIEEAPCVRYEGVWEICDVETGECETFCGSGDGNNLVWAANSAQTVAKKQGLLDYFEVSWPQPTDWLKVVREAIAELKPAERIEAIKSIIPENIAKATGIIDQLGDFYENVYKKKGAKNASVSRKRKS